MPTCYAAPLFITSDWGRGRRDFERLERFERFGEIWRALQRLERLERFEEIWLNSSKIASFTLKCCLEFTHTKIALLIRKLQVLVNILKIESFDWGSISGRWFKSTIPKPQDQSALSLLTLNLC